MRRKIFSTRLRSTLLAIFTLTLFAASAHAAIEKVLHSFGNGKDGITPSSNQILDKAGNLYGTTVYGGSGTCNSFLADNPRFECKQSCPSAKAMF
jgi:hypothetical protein